MDQIPVISCLSRATSQPSLSCKCWPFCAIASCEPRISISGSFCSSLPLDAGKGGVELGEDPLRLRQRRRLCRRAPAASSISPLRCCQKKGSPPAGWRHPLAFHVRESVRLLKESEPSPVAWRTGLLCRGRTSQTICRSSRCIKPSFRPGNSAKGLS